MEEREKLSTASEPFDELLAGGLERGIITNVYGPPGVGKTNFCLQVAHAAISDGPVIFVDSEGSFSVERFLQLHPEKNDLSRILLRDIYSFEDQRRLFRELPSLVEEHKPVVLIFDSFVALYRLELSNANASELNRELSSQLATLSQLARKSGFVVLLTNQTYLQFDSDTVRLVGNDVPMYWSKCLLSFEKQDRRGRTVTITKHRSLPEGLSVRFEITNEGLIRGNRRELPFL